MLQPVCEKYQLHQDDAILLAFLITPSPILFTFQTIAFPSKWLPSEGHLGLHEVGKDKGD